MTTPPSLEPSTPGVYVLGADGSYELVHAFEPGASYGLFDILEFLELGEVIAEEETTGLALDGLELAAIASLAHAARYEHPAGFIALCESLAKTGQTAPGEPFHFYAFP